MSVLPKGYIRGESFKTTGWQRFVIKFFNLAGRADLSAVYIRNHGKLNWDTGWVRNTVTTAGKAQLALLAGDATAIPFTYLAVGTSNTAPTSAQTALIAEIVDTGLARAAATVSRVTTTSTNDTLQLTYTWTSSGAKTIEEIAMFNAASTGTMLGRALTTSKTMANTDVFVGTYKVQFT